MIINLMIIILMIWEREDAYYLDNYYPDDEDDRFQGDNVCEREKGKRKPIIRADARWPEMSNFAD